MSMGVSVQEGEIRARKYRVERVLRQGGMTPGRPQPPLAPEPPAPGQKAAYEDM